MIGLFSSSYWHSGDFDCGFTTLLSPLQVQLVNLRQLVEKACDLVIHILLHRPGRYIINV